jgi:hypothetical protein
MLQTERVDRFAQERVNRDFRPVNRFDFRNCRARLRISVHDAINAATPNPTRAARRAARDHDDERESPTEPPTSERMDRIGRRHIEPEIARRLFSRQEWRISDPEALAQAIRDVNAAIRLLRWRRRRLETFRRQHLPASTRNSSIDCGLTPSARQMQITLK